MGRFFFRGSEQVKADASGRFVIPQEMRFGLIENGKLEFALALGFGGSLAIYPMSEMEKLVESFRGKEHLARYQSFFTLFFSTLHTATCDEKGRVQIPALLRKAIGLPEDAGSELVVAGVMNRVEIWPAAAYAARASEFLKGSGAMESLFEEAAAGKSGGTAVSDSVHALFERANSDGISARG